MSKSMIDELKKSQLQDELLDISDEDAEAIIGGECTYASQTYSTGSVVKQGDGNNYTCQANGTWQRS